MPHPGGRPPMLYTHELGKEICHVISFTPHGLERLCEQNPNWPGATIIKRWVKDIPEFMTMYVQAKQSQLDFFGDSIIDIAEEELDDNMVKINRAKLKIDAIKHRLAQLAPTKWGKSPVPDDATLKFYKAMTEKYDPTK